MRSRAARRRTGSAAAHVVSSTIAVTMTNAQLKLEPAMVLAGAVVFKIANRGRVSRNFTIAGKTTQQIAAGRSAKLTVELTRKGSYSYFSVRRDRPGRLTGLLEVLLPCTNPATTTDSVQMAQDQGGNHGACGGVSRAVGTGRS